MIKHIPIDLKGQRFGKLVVLYEGERSRDGKQRRWVCKCDCGKLKAVEQRNLKMGLTKSCGCMNHKKRKYEHPCPFPCSGCPESLKGLCCSDCNNKTVCENVCLNDPNKCGRFEVKE